MRFLVLGAMALLVGCGGGRTAPRVTGEVGLACLASGRSDASRALCGCIDRVAQQTLTSREQSTFASYFSDPEALQSMKLDDRPAAERLWARYDAFVDAARATCEP